MMHALASGMRRPWTWLGVLLVVSGASGSEAMAQGTAKKAQPADSKKADAPAAKKAAAPSAKADGAALKGADGEAAVAADAVADAPVKGGGSLEVFKDPRAEEALTKLKTVPGLRDCRSSEIASVKSMAAGQAPVDRDTIQRFVDGMAFRLTDKNSINALTNPGLGANPRAALNIQAAVDNLIEPLSSAKATKNAAFLSAYNSVLIATLPKLLDNHLVARTEAMIVLGQTGSKDAIPVYIKQLKDANQTVWVKLWALKGITDAIDHGVTVGQLAGTADVAKAVADFLESQKDIPWPAQLRAIEALGALRMSATPTARDKAEMAAAAMKALTDPSGNLEVRARAAWALGMFQVSPSVAKYNYPLIAHAIGQLSAELGEKVLAAQGENRTNAEYLTGLLVSPIHQAFHGLEGARESGLLNAPTVHPAVGPNLNYLRQIAELESAVALASVELVRAPKGQVPTKKKDLGDRVAALRTFLAKNLPKDFHLVPPGGPEYRGEKAEVAVTADPKEAEGEAAGGK